MSHSGEGLSLFSSDSSLLNDQGEQATKRQYQKAYINHLKLKVRKKIIFIKYLFIMHLRIVIVFLRQITRFKAWCFHLVLRDAPSGTIFGERIFRPAF